MIDGYLRLPAVPLQILKHKRGSGEMILCLRIKLGSVHGLPKIPSEGCDKVMLMCLFCSR